MQHRQRGMTMLGIILVVIVVGAWVYAGIRLVPKYLEYMRVASTLEKVRDEFDSNPGSTEFMLRKAIERHFDIEMVEVITANDIEIDKEGGHLHDARRLRGHGPARRQRVVPGHVRQVGRGRRALSGCAPWIRLPAG